MNSEFNNKIRDLMQDLIRMRDGSVEPQKYKKTKFSHAAI